MLYRVEARVSLKPGVLDAPGQVLQRSLHNLGFDEVKEVRVGKHITMEVEADSPEQARARVAQMGEQLLANPVVELFDFEIFEGAEAAR
ncbi:MAG: phosphoribosylformylglycinamidine synthase subunit PurS [Armatimonadetes bacterium]|nr:phosphoribosylformylglycinamidine synthase subunit PurS [Armatimonadota bacterium]